MTFVRKFSGDRSASIVAVYTCPTHGEMDIEVQRDENGEAPDVIECGEDDDCWDCGGQPSATGRKESGCKTCEMSCHAPCPLPATWTPSATVGCRVRRIEVVRGKWERPERKTYLDTRDLGEGQDPEEFAAKRKAIWEEKRKERVMKAVRE